MQNFRTKISYIIMLLSIHCYAYADDTLQFDDPTRTPQPAAVGPQDPIITLSGIAYIDMRQYCIINNKVLMVGDTINDFIVKEISHDKVVLVDKKDNLTVLTL